MSYLINLVLAGRPAVVVGGGSVASRKIHELLEARADVTVISPAVCAPVEVLAAAGRIRLHLRPYTNGDLRGAVLAIAATDDEQLNGAISRDAQALGILVNVVDRPALCTFTLPAVVRRGDLTVAVSTEGQCPALAGVMREELAERYGDEYAAVVRALGTARREAMAQGWSGARIRESVRELYQAGLAEMIRRNDGPALAALWRAVLGAGFTPPPGME
jgi:precorrin-2 dehydrogenase/sirohydrochlorin ferrochelatase